MGRRPILRRALRSLTSVRRKDYAVGVVLLSLGLLSVQTVQQAGLLYRIGHRVHTLLCQTALVHQP